MPRPFSFFLMLLISLLAGISPLSAKERATLANDLHSGFLALPRDPAGRPTRLTDTTRGTTLTTRFGHDAAKNRIQTQAVSYENGVLTDTLDRVFEYGSATNTRNSNQLYQLTETAGANPPAAATYSYDSNGNRNHRDTATASDIFTYDSANRLTRYQLATSTTAENGDYRYSYDPLSRRIARRAGTDPPINSPTPA